MPKVYLAVLDVGHGTSAVLVDTGGVTVVDTGPGSALLEFMQNEKLTQIETVVVSHADKDHIAGLVALLASNTVRINGVVLNTDSSKGSKLWDDLTFSLDAAAKHGALTFQVALTPNDTGRLDRGEIGVEVVAPSNYLAAKGAGSQDRQGRTLTSNSMSAVIRLCRGGAGIALLPGDIDAAGLENIADAGGDATAIVAMFPHHGGKPGGGDMAAFAGRFCQMVRPKVVVFSTGRGSHSTPQPEIVQAVREAAPDVWILCTQLSEHCCDRLPSDAPGHLADLFARGRLANSCCAGSILVDLDNKLPQILPDRKEHAAFVASVAPKAICCRQAQAV